MIFLRNTLMLLALTSGTAFATGTLENPGNQDTLSGIGLISGWHCDAAAIDIYIDSKPAKRASYGTPRSDTQDVCGDSDNGFGYLYNFNLLGDGQHSVSVRADGVEFASATFNVVTFGESFLSGVTGSYKLRDFPEPGQESFVEWRESLQNFSITGTGPAQSAASENICICVDTVCGNGYVDAASGQFFKDIENLSNFLDPTALGAYESQGSVTSEVSGWTCSSLARTSTRITVGVFELIGSNYVENVNAALTYEVGATCETWSRTTMGGPNDSISGSHLHYNAADESYYDSVTDTFGWTEYGPEHSQADIEATCAAATGGAVKTVNSTDYYADDHNGAVTYLKITHIEKF